MIAHTLKVVPTQMTILGPSDPVEHPPKGVTLKEIQTAAGSYTVEVSNMTNTYGPAALKAGNRVDKWSSWDAAIKVGIMNFATSEITVQEFVTKHRIAMKPWMKLAYQWAVAHEDSVLIVANDRYDWMVYERGDYVCFQLPHHDRGGEKEYVSKDGKSRVQISED